MRSRFLAAAGPADRLTETFEASQWHTLPAGWTILLRLDQLLVITRDDEPALVFPDGALLGTIFSRASMAALEKIGPGLNHAILASRGQYLIESYWGAWFAIFRDDGGHWALRDPSPCAPAFHRSSGEVSIYCSDLQTSEALDASKRAVDPEFLRHWLVFPHLRTARTGLEGMSELLPGTRRRAGTGKAMIETAWDPRHFASAESRIADFEEAADQVRRETLRVIPAQAEGRGRLLLELSGGLDSSIVAASLGAAQVPFQTVNFVTKAAEGDERRYARAVAEGLSEQHSEIGEKEASLALSLPDRRSFRPGLTPVMIPLHRQFADHGREMGADTLLTGAGGDNVFCFLSTAAPILDAWRELGPAAALGATLRDVADMGGCTIWTALRFAMRKALRELRDPGRWPRETDFLMPEALPAGLETHPWLDGFRDALPGTREHVIALMRIQHVTDPETRIPGLRFIHPLVAQPIAELCLRIPTWLWVRGGHNRAVARHAFRGLLPEEVLARRSKGGLESLCIRAFGRHKSEIADLLLGGLLREAELLDPDSLETYLERSAPPSDTRYFRLFELLSAELWLRSWRS